MSMGDPLSADSGSRLTASLELLLGSALYRGQGHDSGFHRHHAVQIGVAFDGVLQVRGSPEEQLRDVHGFVVAPNALHQVRSAGCHCAFVWSEAVRAKLGFVWRETTDEEVSALRALMVEGTSSSRKPTHIVQAALKATQTEPRPQRNDSRVRLARAWIAAHPNAAGFEALAAQLNLSTSRLRHLFRAETGISLQRYALWQKTHQALTLASSNSLTDAALDAGFSDSSHFSRTFRESFGLTPSDVFSHSVQVRLWRDDLNSIHDRRSIPDQQLE